MWEHDVGAVPVVGSDGSVVGMITDRDICMAVYTRGGTLDDHRVSSAMSNEVHACTPEDTTTAAEELMQTFQIRRVPVIDDDRLVGILSLNDIALAAKSKSNNDATLQDAGATLAAVCENRRRPSSVRAF